MRIFSFEIPAARFGSILSKKAISSDRKKQLHREESPVFWLKLAACCDDSVEHTCAQLLFFLISKALSLKFSTPKFYTHVNLGRTIDPHLMSLIFESRRTAIPDL